MSTTSSDWRATSACGGGSTRRCARPRARPSARGRRRGCSPSFATARARAGRAARRVIAKAEQIEGKQHPRYVVTSLPAQQWQPRPLYEDLYCARGEMENRIKEQMSLFAGRMSAATMRANQLRLYLSAAAYVLMEALRRLALRGTALAEAQVHTIRLRLLKIGARIRFSARRVVVSMSSGYPWKQVFGQMWAALRC